MKNYYDELEVSKTASKEVIEKVYRVLAKKYHPDTTTEANKKLAEEKFKVISEAYETLSNDEKRKKYDLELEQANPIISYEDYMEVVYQRDTLNNSLRDLQNEFNQFRNSYDWSDPYNRNAQTQYNQNQFNQYRYKQPNQNYGNNFNNYGRPDMNSNYSNTNTGTKNKKYYYNVETGEPVSSADYYKYKIREFLSNIGFYIVLMLILIMLIKRFFTIGLSAFLF